MATIPRSGADIKLPEEELLNPGTKIRIMDYNQLRAVVAVVGDTGKHATPTSRARAADDQAEAKSKGSTVVWIGSTVYVLLVIGMLLL